MNTRSIRSTGPAKLAIECSEWGESYDLPRDPTQLSNVAEKHPELVARMSEQVLSIESDAARRVGMIRGWHRELSAAGDGEGQEGESAGSQAKAKGKLLAARSVTDSDRMTA